MQFEKNNEKLIRYLSFSVMVLISVLLAVLALFRLPDSIEKYMEDLLYRRLDGIPEDIKIIAIDEKSLNRLGPYSDWNRELFAKLIEMLDEDEKLRPQVIGIDIVFTGSNDSEEDKALAETVGRYDNIVLASALEGEREIAKNGDKYYVRNVISEEHKPYDALEKVAQYGFTNAITDTDGVVRRAYTGFPPDYTSFACTIASKLAELPEYNNSEEIIYPLKPGEAEAVSMADVLDGTIPVSNFTGSVVLIGAYSEGMMDVYKVPCDYSRQMYGVEMQANYISAFLNGKVVRPLPGALVFITIFLLSLIYGVLILKSGMRGSLKVLISTVLAYPIVCYLLFCIFSVKLPLVAVSAGFVIIYIGGIFHRYADLLRKRQRDTQKMLFSMAEGFAEAIEGRTPYNANHTKNVAKRCIEMLDYINELHKEKKTDYFFTAEDKRQLYLAAMLHDVGKMDVPLEVMDKPTKLGSKEARLRDRLKIIELKLQNDILTGRRDKAEAGKEIEKIREFTDNIQAFNCGRPLKEEEWAVIEKMEEGCYEEEDGTRIPYLTDEEKDDLHIKAGTLSDGERTIMQSHVVYTDKILSHMTFGDEYRDVRHMAADHHELLNGKGYPKKLESKDIDVMTRILTIMDIYDSLIADDRPYKKPKSVKAAFEILDEEAEAGKIDAGLLQFAKELYLEEHED